MSGFCPCKQGKGVVGEDPLDRMAPKKLPLRPNVCMLVYNRQGKLFLGERCNKRGHWQLPQGGAEPRYTLRENVIRELREELGVGRRHLGKIKKLQSKHEYEWGKAPQYARGRWRGQKQTFWVIEFTGGDDDIDLDHFKEPEFSSWRWCSVSEVKRRAAPIRRAGYRGALAEFSALKRELLQSSARRRKRSAKR